MNDNRPPLKAKRLRSFASRCFAVAAALAFVATGCLVQLANLQLLGKNTALAATQGRTTQITVNAKRGKILDANGIVLAQSVERYNIIADPQLANEFTPTTCAKGKESYCHQINGKPVGATGAAAVARLLATVFTDMNAMELGAKLSDANSRYAVIAKDVTPEIKRKIDDLHLGGIVYGELTNERVYSGGTMLGPVLGGVDAQGNGVAGLEASLDKTLTGTDGYQVYQRGLGGEMIPGTLTDSKDAVNGSDVTLTVDSNVDWYVKKALIDGKAKYNASWAMAVVADIKTGDILALEDTDEYEAGSDDAKLNTSRVVSEVFEPGSIGKVFTMAGVLQEGQHKATDQFTVPDTITTDDGQTYKDAETHADEHWTYAGILKNSSNVGMILSASNYSDQQRYDYLKKFGIGQKTGLDLSGESAGILSNYQDWDLRTRNTVLFGQGYAMNALQITQAIATIGNKGVMPKLRLIASTTDSNGHVSETKNGNAVRVVDESVASQVLNAMESVSDLYKNMVSVPGYRIAAKSGTAEVAGEDGKLTSIISDWSGIIPADNPRFVITVVMKDAKVGSFGGLTAGPVFATIGEFLMQKYNVSPSAERTDAIPVEW
ncbi:peptidoglycan D,D-transpeptidase FtsI family protein [Bifidobacterium simiiventris]|uniref:peptidoglycan D,D-transpeptidase FtsI family protein n=1 Tax=Bifidobacterium simiiventris TaxID=2834434 RepID=UPI001C5780EF|nr:penicillin-binding protein 2 [Bifidobacterium simiiventris]